MTIKDVFCCIALSIFNQDSTGLLIVNAYSKKPKTFRGVMPCNSQYEAITPLNSCPEGKCRIQVISVTLELKEERYFRNGS